ncbi:SIMPL domain-containing protein [Neptunitalea lumnitzerae]|uniref:SIMPL domain-containing protein n=1 Tax=Neptunitalea lumnitzerae TaxID=2965509 RepID=A0ABQ5MLA6_9FLAO|nr:SIMPL domain-containing protein [Neptunitalea sp. Y10]GLB50164.1 SIMPL domain-containing protein [Neptunitalea sp. Y10]
MKKILLVLLVCSVGLATAQTKDTMIPTVSVTGTGNVTIVPDGVTISVKIENEGNSAIEVKKQNDQSIDATIKFLKKSKLDKSNYKTEYVRISKNYNYQTKEYKYVATQTLLIELKDLSKYESIMQGLFENGVNGINNISFTSTKIKELQAEARKKAIANAKQKALEYVSVLDQNIGKAIQISESGSNYVPTPVMYKTVALADGSAPENTIAEGEMEISVNISVVFELK